jgi:hypothetical protein
MSALPWKRISSQTATFCDATFLRFAAANLISGMRHFLLVCTELTRDNSRSGDADKSIMNISIPITLAISLMPAEVECSELVLRTAFGGVFCATPFQLRKAIIAASADDGARIRQLGCLRTGGGIEAVWIDQIALPYGPWQVRLLPSHAPPITVWGYALSFENDSEEEASR